MKKLMLAGLALAVISGCATTSQEIPIHTYPVVELQQTGQFEPGKAIQAIVAGFVDKSGWGDDSIAEALEGQVSKVVDTIEKMHLAEITDHQTQIIRLGPEPT